VRHESPQAILLRDGKPVWKASHFRITAGALAQALWKMKNEE
jgi:bacillithiol system protein YtxJ